MKKFALWLNSPVGQVIRDIVEGGVAGALAAVLALQLDVTSLRGIFMAAATGFIAAAIAVARRRVVGRAQAAPAPPAQ